MKFFSRIPACLVLLIAACPAAALAAPADLASSPSLAAAPAPAAEPNVDTAALIALFERSDFAALDSALKPLLANYDPSIPYDYRELEIAIDALNVYQPAREQQFQRWLTANPDSYFAHLLYASFMIKHAWDARGTGWATSVTSQGWQLFSERLEIARTEFERAIKLAPRTPFAYTGLVTIAMGLSESDDVVQQSFTTCRAVDPSYLRIHEAVLSFLQPRWGGSLARMFNFARRWGPDAPPHSLVQSSLFIAHSEAAYENEEWWQRPEVWEELHPVLERLGREFPERTFINDYHARLASASGHWDVAREQFEKLGLDFRRGTWLSDYHFFESRARAMAGGAKGDIDAQHAWFAGAAQAALALDPRNLRLRLMRAQALSSIGKPREAEMEYNSIRENDPANSDASHGLAHLWLYETKEYEKALAEYDKLAEKRAGEGFYQFRRGLALEGLTRAPEALEAYRKAVALTPDESRHWTSLLNCMYGLKQYEEMLAEVDAAYEAPVDPDERPTHISRVSRLHAYALFQLTRQKEARDVLRRMIADDDEDADAHFWIYRIEKDNPDPELQNPAAREHLVKAVAGRGANSEWAQELVIDYGRDRRFDEAEAVAAEARKRFPESPAILKVLGDVLRDGGQYDKAVLAYDQYLALEPGSADAVESRDRCRKAIETGQLPAAAPPLARGISTVEDFIGLVATASRGKDPLAVVGMADSGLTKFDLSANPAAEASLRYYKASALRKLGRIPESLAECELGLARNPEELYTLYLASSVMLRQPAPETDVDKALDYARRAVAIAGRREPAYLENLVAALIANDKLEEASAVNKELLALVPTDPRSRYRQRFLDKQEKPDINATPAEIKQALGFQ